LIGGIDEPHQLRLARAVPVAALPALKFRLPAIFDPPLAFRATSRRAFFLRAPFRYLVPRQGKPCHYQQR